MHVDAVTTAAVADELRQKIADGRVQDVVEIDRQSIGLEIYARGERHYLLASIDPQAARCHLVPGKLRRGVERASPLGLLLHKYVEGARLIGVQQPHWERVLHLDFSGENGDTRLIVETMGNRSNIILTVEGEILDCIKRVGPDQNRYRVILPGRAYVPPPPQDKVLPEQVTRSMIGAFLQQTPDALAWRVLVDHIAGISPLLAREIIYFASGDALAPAFDVEAGMVHAAFTQRLGEIQRGEWLPCVVPSSDGRGYTAFAAYRLTHLEGWQQADSISAAIAAYFGAPVGAEAYTPGKQAVHAQIDEARRRARRKQEALERELAGAEQIELLRKKGELLLAYGPTLKRGERVLRAQYDPDGPPIEVEVDPQLTHVENARRYFEQYEKAKRAAADVPRLLEQAQQEAAYLEQLATDLEIAESWPEIDAVREELQESGHWRGSRTRGPRGGKPGIRRITTDDGFVILAGRNAAQNHTLVTERSAPADLWLHARDRAGGHVIIKHDGRPIPDEVVQRAAELAAYYSAGRDEASVEVVVTERRYVRPIKGGRPGMVTYKHERALAVRPQR
jgi:predicted ribosome quality control (RQC) complex YloA/Tae2 family protein